MRKIFSSSFSLIIGEGLIGDCAVVVNGGGTAPAAVVNGLESKFRGVAMAQDLNALDPILALDKREKVERRDKRAENQERTLWKTESVILK